jgi:hypothetical protein
LVVSNSGLAAARNLTVLVDKKDVTRHPSFRPDLTNVHRIGPGAEVEFRLIEFDQMVRNYFVELRWTDDAKQEAHWSSDLVLGR